MGLFAFQAPPVVPAAPVKPSLVVVPPAPVVKPARISPPGLPVNGFDNYGGDIWTVTPASFLAMQRGLTVYDYQPAGSLVRSNTWQLNRGNALFVLNKNITLAQLNTSLQLANIQNSATINRQYVQSGVTAVAVVAAVVASAGLASAATSPAAATSANATVIPGLATDLPAYDATALMGSGAGTGALPVASLPGIATQVAPVISGATPLVASVAPAASAAGTLTQAASAVAAAGAAIKPLIASKPTGGASAATVAAPPPKASPAATLGLLGIGALAVKLLFFA